LNVEDIVPFVLVKRNLLFPKSGFAAAYWVKTIGSLQKSKQKKPRALRRAATKEVLVY